MCFSRRDWFDELARREREEQELRDLFERDARRPAPAFVADTDSAAQDEEREPVSA
ncbi:MAG: hypothetical protein QOH46_4105 [Solirubrobacteraceae bacterium]|jgi:hypothetical protein|nr:hypothetical protein [Solirubrobacteraceae bacterium]